ncbi:Asp23/Gls24 family envelope stress response protein [Selenihalanaerobacter shriftii]|uniref:Asp23 family, cell envelope-related function n=1 Tax=Selenihalanaerobacter shriftii TaxID=142842 RepID=A0A1T4JTN3_9FIRM|nr:Asp23/Gls24 family envelope stress response protein [Selenihalanaerobacter shriftii]SJZ33570.1 Asp23 family, cell envelope-related function [Selenihalanaerobacter shriftii]
MDVYALVGSSGTGKSHRARMVAYGNNIDYIIDDGLLIKGSKVIGGKSAKQEDNKIKAVKRAIFIEEEHAREIKSIIHSSDVPSILILGTSDKMIYRIIEALDLVDPTEIIRIEDIASPEEMEMAKQQRQKEGKHVIPVPNVEVKPNFSGYLMESLELLFSNKNDEITAEKTIVRPKFSYYGKLLIADRVMTDLVEYTLEQDLRVDRIKKIKVNQNEAGTEISIRLILEYGLMLHEVAHELQLNIKKLLEDSTGVTVLRVDIKVEGLVV